MIGVIIAKEAGLVCANVKAATSAFQGVKRGGRLDGLFAAGDDQDVASLYAREVVGV
jgi:hypothetical protein